jgi:hypothetical protein
MAMAVRPSTAGHQPAPSFIAEYIIPGAADGEDPEFFGPEALNQSLEKLDLTRVIEVVGRDAGDDFPIADLAPGGNNLKFGRRQ